MKEVVEETVRYLITHAQLLSKLPKSDSPLYNLMDTSHRVEFTLDKVHELQDILDASFFLTAGESTEIDVVRDGSPLTFSVKPMLHPSARNSELHATQTEADIPALH